MNDQAHRFEAEALLGQASEIEAYDNDDRLAVLRLIAQAQVHATLAALERAPAVAVQKGDIIRIIPDRGPVRLMRVAHVERHIITLADLPGTDDESEGQ